ncbi:MAG TPA: ribosomal protein S18-alanine N-acetyltransferase [Candidatus Acidoferrales bacterium]|nr:ribosomal protein S18-alanine N-acetyltransferase [Candidatus Acidoferrales bacterium]
MTIRPLELGDGPALERITAQSPEASSWPAGSYRDFTGWAAELSGAVAGFVVARIAADELEILNLAVDPAERGRGIGRELLARVLAFGGEAGARRAVLEVRESNQGARRFYAAQGFAAVGRRPGYYRDPVEDALLMARAIEGAGKVGSGCPSQVG